MPSQHLRRHKSTHLSKKMRNGEMNWRAKRQTREHTGWVSTQEGEGMEEPWRLSNTVAGGRINDRCPEEPVLTGGWGDEWRVLGKLVMQQWIYNVQQLQGGLWFNGKWGSESKLQGRKSDIMEDGGIKNKCVAGAKWYKVRERECVKWE